MAEPKRHMDVPQERVWKQIPFNHEQAPNVGYHQALH